MKGGFQFLEVALYLLSRLQTQHIRHLKKHSNVDGAHESIWFPAVHKHVQTKDEEIPARMQRHC